MNNAWTRFLGKWIGIRQKGSIFEEAEYFEAPVLLDGEKQIFLRARNGSISRRTCEYEDRGRPYNNPWSWAPVDGLARGCRKISEEEANRPPEGWMPPTQAEIEEHTARIRALDAGVSRDEDETAEQLRRHRPRCWRWEWIAPV